jgi:hypothetical protein
VAEERRTLTNGKALGPSLHNHLQEYNFGIKVLPTIFTIVTPSIAIIQLK